jgi:hypothetical protein
VGGAVGRGAFGSRHGPAFVGALPGDGQLPTSEGQRGSDGAFEAGSDLFSSGTGAERSQGDAQKEQSRESESSHTRNVAWGPAWSLSRAVVVPGISLLDLRPRVWFSPSVQAVARVVAGDLPAATG